MGKNVIISTLPNISQNYLPKVNTSNIFANSLVYDDGSSVLINTTTASAFRLDVNGTGRFQGALTGTSATFSGSLIVGTGTTGTQYFANASAEISYSATTGLWRFNNLAGGSAPTTYYQFAADGTPILSILKSGAATFSGTGSFKSLGAAADVFTLGYSGAAVNMLQVYELSGGTNTEFNLRNSSGTSINRLSTNGNSFFNGGNVGIGTTSPSGKLTVEGTVGTEIASIGSSAQKLYFWPDGGGVMLSTATSQGGEGIYFGNSSDFMYFQTAATERMRITSGGRVGINQTSPGVALSVAGQSENWQLALTSVTATAGAVIGSPSADVLAFGNWAGTERMRITSGGNVLIGTTSAYNQGITMNGTTGEMGSTTNNSCNFQFWNQATTGNNLFATFYTEGGGGALRGYIDYNRIAGLTRYNTTSDANLKNIIGLSDRKKSVDILSCTKIREYSWKDDETNNIQIGVIAQELYETFKGAVSKGSDQELFGSKEYKNWAVDKTAFTFHLIAGWQEHERIIQELNQKITLLENK